MKLPQITKPLKFGMIGLAAGVVLGIAGTLFVSSYNPPDAVSQTASAVFGRIVSQNELVSVSQQYSIVRKAEDTNKLLDIIDVPFTENSFWYRYAGTLKAGVNLETAEIEPTTDGISIALDAPYIISNTPDMDESGVLEENNNILNPIHVEDVDALQRDCIEQSESDALKGGLLDEARTEAEDRLTSLFQIAMGEDYNVRIIWRDAVSDSAEN